MTGTLPPGVTAVVLDIEGTTTPITFVAEVLFPYARAHLHEFLADARNASAVADARALLATEHAPDEARGERPPAMERDLEPYLLWLMDCDRKSPGLKFLQGLIWQAGYKAGELRGQVYPDVPPTLRRWHSQGVVLAIYSSGSELAQRLLFQSTQAGDLTPLFTGFFDTSVGAKTDPASYARIAAALGRPPAEILFISDLATELRAAEAAGLHTELAVR